MEREPNLVISEMSKPITEDGIRFKIEICKLEDDTQWSMAVSEDYWINKNDKDEAENSTRSKSPCSRIAYSCVHAERGSKLIKRCKVSRFRKITNDIFNIGVFT